MQSQLLCDDTGAPSNVCLQLQLHEKEAREARQQ
jgi:hypothetical protein